MASAHINVLLTYGFGLAIASFKLWLWLIYGISYVHGYLNNIEQDKLKILSKWPTRMASPQLCLWYSYCFG